MSSTKRGRKAFRTGNPTKGDPTAVPSATSRRRKTKKTAPANGRVASYIKHVENGETLTYIENLIAEAAVKSGRPRQFTVKMLLVGLMLIADEGVLHLSRLCKALNNLDAGTKQKLGITGVITRRQVEHLYGLVAKLLERNENADEVSRFDTFDKLCDATLRDSHRGATKTGSLAVDGTSIESWGTRRVDKRTGEIKITDEDAKWKKRSKDSPWKKPIFGFDLTVAVQVPDSTLDDAPLFARSMRLRPATHKPVEAGLETVISAHQQMQDETIAPHDVLADREYTATLDGTGFLNPVRALGFDPVFDLTLNQLGVANTVKGALIIDGQPHSPATPLDLRHLIPPPVNGSVEEKIAYQNKIKVRSKYALVRHGKALPNGAQDYVCPAHAGKIACPLANIVNPLVVQVQNHPKKAARGSVCAKKYTRFHANETPLNQKDLYGSFEWSMSMTRRNLVEGFFGNLKNEATENLKRGSIRVRGLMKTGIMVLFSVAATNMRLIRGKNANPRPQRRRGRKPIVGIKAHNPIMKARSNAPPEVETT